MRLRTFILSILLIALLLVGGAIVYGRMLWEDFNSAGPAAQDITLVVPKGTGINGIAELLADAGIIDNKLAFRIGARIVSEGRGLQAGEYIFPPKISPRAAMQLMIDGKVVQHKVTIPEGLTVAEIFDLLTQTPLLDGDLPSAPTEGSLLPQTYLYLRGETRNALVDRMQREMDATLQKLWAQRDLNVPLKTPAEAVVLASLIEKETGQKDERAHVAAVFYNRMKQNMPLQSDPTVIFALTKGKTKMDRSLTYADLKLDNPYNTYVKPGLPPGPIANPGFDALVAALHPLSSKDLYFVADGTGGHAFAATIDEHNKNVAKWRKLQKANSGD
jgi:UPF0755 protein